MTPRHERQMRVAIVCGLVLVGFVLVSLFDDAAYHAIGPTMPSRARLDGQWWYLVLRHTGSMWTWLLAGLACLAWDVGRAHRLVTRPAWKHGVFLALTPATSGLAAELLKLVIGRERPATIQPIDGVETLVYQGYHFRGLFSGFVDGSNLGLPSSHAAVAAGGAFALQIIAPRRVGRAAMVLAVGCGFSRMLTGAHFASDVFAGLVVGFMMAEALRRLLGVGPDPAWGAMPGDRTA